MSGGLDARSLQDMRERAEKWARWADDGEERQIGTDVLWLLDERERLEASLRLANAEIRIREESQIPVIPRGAQAKIDRLESMLERVGERASLDSPEAQQ